MAVPSNIDLTHNLDFSKEEPVSRSINLAKSSVDNSYKRYNEYKNTSTTSDWITKEFSFDIPRGTTSTVGTFAFPIHNTIKVEERVCWRKLFKDPRVYEQTYTVEEWEDRLKNMNFSMGSKNDRLYYLHERLRIMEENNVGFCDRCGKQFNLNNCFSHYYGLCAECHFDFESHVSSVTL